MAIVNITTQSDSDFQRQFVYKTEVPDAPIDLTGATMHMSLRRKASDTTVALKLSTSDGSINMLNLTAGIFQITILQEKLMELEPGTYDHSLIMKKNGLRTKVWSGTLTHTAGPSRDEL